MAQNFPWQFAGNFQQWAGRWTEMPVDAHMLIALSAPRPVFISGGTADQWADPVGMFKAAVAAGPVYRLLGKKDLGTTELPALDTPLTSGDIGWTYHTGGHTPPPPTGKPSSSFWGRFLGRGHSTGTVTVRRQDLYEAGRICSGVARCSGLAHPARPYWNI